MDFVIVVGRRGYFDAPAPLSTRIRFRYEPVFEDYWLLNRYCLVKQSVYGWKAHALAAVFLLAFLVLPWVLHHNETAQNGGTHWYYAQFLVIPVLIYALPALIYWSARRRWRKSCEVNEPREYELDDEGVRVRAHSFSGALAWEALVFADYWRGLMILRTTQNQYYYFPLASTDQRAELVELVLRKIQKSDGLATIPPALLTPP